MKNQRNCRDKVSLPPKKWLKYELLQQHGLRDLGLQRQSIYRVPRAQSVRFIAQLRRAMRSAALVETRSLFVVKFVPMNLGMMLRNVRVTSEGDLRRVEQAIKQESSKFDELWFCHTNVSPGGLSVAGRLAIDLIGTDRQIIEQVWRCSPRLIEILGPRFPFPFVRAHRMGWNWSPEIDKLHLPRGLPETETTMLQELGIALTKLNEKKDQLEFFCNAIGELGLNVCLEYKLEEGRLQIIDWDTPNDSLVLERLLPELPWIPPPY